MNPHPATAHHGPRRRPPRLRPPPLAPPTPETLRAAQVAAARYQQWAAQMRLVRSIGKILRSEDANFRAMQNRNALWPGKFVLHSPAPLKEGVMLSEEMDRDLQALDLAAEPWRVGSISPNYQQFESREALLAALAARMNLETGPQLLHWLQQRVGSTVVPLLWLGPGPQARKVGDSLSYLIERVPLLIEMTRAMVAQVAEANDRALAAQRETLMLRATLRLLTQRVQALTSKHGGDVETYFQACVQLAVKQLGREEAEEKTIMQEMLAVDDWQLYEENRLLTNMLIQERYKERPPARPVVQTQITAGSLNTPALATLGAETAVRLRPVKDSDMLLGIEEIEEFQPPRQGVALRAKILFASPDRATQIHGTLDVGPAGNILQRSTQNFAPVSGPLWAAAWQLVQNRMRAIRERKPE